MMNQPNNEEPGLNCPQCGFRIKITIDDILYKSKFVCPGCGLELVLDRGQSQDTIKALQDLHVAIQNLHAAQKFER